MLMKAEGRFGFGGIRPVPAERLEGVWVLKRRTPIMSLRSGLCG